MKIKGRAWKPGIYLECINGKMQVRILKSKSKPKKFKCTVHYSEKEKR